MTRCPNCRRPADQEERVCSFCNEPLDNEQGPPRSSQNQREQQQPAEKQANQTGGRSQDSGRQRAPPQRQPQKEQPGQRPPQRGQPQQGPPPQSRQKNKAAVAGLTRRQLLGIGGGIILVGGAGILLSGGGDSSSRPNPEVIDVEQDGEQVEFGTVRWDFDITVENSGGAGDVRVVVAYPGGNIERDEIVRMNPGEQRQVRIENVEVTSPEADQGRNIFAEPAQ